VEYEYSIASTAFQDSKVRGEKYEWMAGSWSDCSEACGGGTQTRTVVCRAASTKEITSDRLCVEDEKPTSQEDCNVEECKVRIEIVSISVGYDVFLPYVNSPYADSP